ncbi:MAG TPA: sugar ABC transporter substrate-binding protein [Elusimicrobia bacterium]|nr:sugar ABC transporter substrate-binding protein [Elusimicrobiota bacterium]
MRRRLALSLVAALTFGSGCAKTDEKTEARTIVLWEQEDAIVAPFIDSLFEGFKKLPGNEDLTFVRTHFNTEDQRQQFQTASIAGNAPDLLLSPSDPAGIYSISGFILPVDGLFDMSRFNKPVVEAISLDGKTWGVPLSNGNHLMMFFNRKFAPKAPETSDELAHWCDANARRHGLSSCWAFFMGEPFWLAPWLGAFGGWPIEGRTPTLDTQPMRDTLKFILDLKFKKKHIPMECDYNCMDALFKERKVAFIVNGDWAISTYQKELGKDFGVAKIPKLSATGRWPTPMVSGKYFLLSSKLQGEKLALVQRFIEYAVSEEVQISQVKALSRLPALSKAARSKVILDDPVLKVSMEQILVGKPMPMATEMRAVWDAVRPIFSRVLAEQVSPDEAPAKMQKEAAAKIAEMNE